MRLKALVRPITGTTRRLVGGEERTQAIASVQIEAADAGFYLLYFDSDGNGITDTWHQTIEEAKGQADFEFGIVDEDWEEIR